MVITILIVIILGFLFVLFSLREVHIKIVNLETKVDEIKEKTDKLGTYNY